MLFLNIGSAPLAQTVFLCRYCFTPWAFQKNDQEVVKKSQVTNVTVPEQESSVLLSASCLRL